MPLTSSVTPLPPHLPNGYTPAHHVGSPPTSFKNPWPSYKSNGIVSAIRTRFTTPKNFVPVPTDRVGLVKVCKPDFSLATTTPTGLKATWIGHASFLIETPASADSSSRGMRILLDPVWSDRVGPYGLVGPVRFTPPPCSIDELPDIDAVAISHDHYDHLDLETLRKLNDKQHGDLRFFCGLGVKAVLVGLGVGIRAHQVDELDWWDGVTVSKPGVASVELVCTPAQHRSGRSPWSFDQTLWCSWVVKAPSASAKDNDKSLFFAGDTGYCTVSSNDEFSHHSAPHPPCPAFKHIGELHGPFDLALLPIGCFKPRAVLSPQHACPEDSLAIHRDVKSRKSIGMHFGTFRGAYSAEFEPVTEPSERWREGAEKDGLEWGKEVGLCDIGESVVV
ncbi:N-acyl-phosphatidylethanolamine-hydrolyzing phospholipase D [Pyrenophora seminiperda CCB06]|uniref:N-acyl-phosphatidylethanolamine-hydrolyzing phospholipase D n=1 Tax=Pyrenophora seminiperda CCB06 TaxID=1302712 RepID=A0A3M7LXL6_9PLEO|nr:N-acyl-phosphatidylethanolamine-hydrolyzing phospholipase D [Pyrenophora seminiperda CCB06]